RLLGSPSATEPAKNVGNNTTSEALPAPFRSRAVPLKLRPGRSALADIIRSDWLDRPSPRDLEPDPHEESDSRPKDQVHLQENEGIEERSALHEAQSEKRDSTDSALDSAPNRPAHDGGRELSLETTRPANRSDNRNDGEHAPVAGGKDRRAPK